MTHLWVRAESRLNEDRVGITPDGVAEVADALRRATAGFAGLVVTTGGTGFSGFSS